LPSSSPKMFTSGAFSGVGTEFSKSASRLSAGGFGGALDSERATRWFAHPLAAIPAAKAPPHNNHRSSLPLLRALQVISMPTFPIVDSHGRYRHDRTCK